MGKTSFLSNEEIHELGLKHYGENVKISRKCSLYSPSTISIGNNVRIDDFSVLSGNITIGSHVHVSAYCGFYGAGIINLEDYTGTSPRCLLFSASDDFSGEYLIGPQVPEEHTNVKLGPITMKRYSQLGANTVVLPNVEIGEGAVTGAMSLVTKNLNAWAIYYGNPAKYIKPRSKKMLAAVKNI